MEKFAGGSGVATSRDTSPRSILGWKDDWGYESADLKSTTAEPLVKGVSPVRSKSIVGFVGHSTADTDGPTTPLHLGRRLFRSLSPPMRPDQRASGSLLIPEAPIGGDSEEPALPEPEEPPTLTFEAFQLEGDEHELWGPVWRRDRRTDQVCLTFPFSRPLSHTSARHDEISVDTAGDDVWSIDSSASTAPVAASGKEETPTNRMQFMASLKEELTSIRACVKRAIDHGKKVQHYGALEVSELRGQKANAEASVQQSVQLNRELEQQVCTLREEVQQVQCERELEVMAMNNEIQELEMERNNLLIVVRDEKKKRENLQNEVDSVLSVLLEGKMKLESERETHDSDLRNEKRKLHAMRKARDAAMRALEDGNKKLEVERDAMLMAMRDMTSRLDFERDDKLRSMRRTSMDIATMMSTLRLGRNNSIGGNDDVLSPRPLSRQNSRQFR